MLGIANQGKGNLNHSDRLPGGPVVKTPLPLQRVWVPSLIGELRSHVPQGAPKKDEREMEQQAITSQLLEWLLSKNRRDSKYWWGCGIKGTLGYCSHYRKTVWQFLKNIKRGTTLWSNNSTSEYLSQDNRNTQKRNMYLMFTTGLFTIAKIRKQPKCLIEE